MADKGRDVMASQLLRVQHLLRWLPLPLAAIACISVTFLTFQPSSSPRGIVELQKLYTQINIMTPDGSSNREPQNANPVTSYMGGYSVPVPAGDSRKAFPYPLQKPEKKAKIDPSKYVLRSEADDRFKQMEKRLKLDEKAMLTMQNTIKQLKARTQ